jgi:transcriptional regulator with XRE-family HTH domain
MNKESVEQLLKRIESFFQAKDLSKMEMAEKLDIPYSTFKKWFQKGKVRRYPTPIYIDKLEQFLKSQEKIEEDWGELWTKILKWWETQHRYSTVREFADEIGWDSQNLFWHLENKERPPILVIDKIARTLGFEIPALDFLVKEAKRKTEKIKYLLLLLEDELRWFRDSSEKAREILRESLDLGDIGYISSLLTMLGDEEKFRRWLTLTTHRFNFFRNKGG